MPAIRSIRVAKPDAIRRIREEHLALTYRAAAGRTNGAVSYGYWANLENGHRTNPSLRTLRAIARALGVGVDDISEPVPLDDVEQVA